MTYSVLLNSLQKKQHQLIESYSNYNYIINILFDNLNQNIEYSVDYDQKTFESLKNFIEYESILKEYLISFLKEKNEFYSLGNLFQILNKEILKNKMKIPYKLFIPIFFKVLQLEKLAPLLLDNQIDEIYLDSSDNNLYIDHSKYGRCSTSIKLKKSEIESFIYRIALENDFSLNHANPTMKADFISSLFHTRVTVDIPPLIIGDYYIDIRKFRNKSLRLKDLIENNSLTRNQALLLAFFIKNRVTITIIGPPNSGKTTLQNALIEFIPSHYRLISIEDVLEASSTRIGKTIKFRLGYDPYSTQLITKSLEIQKILHRSPDFINLGELSTEDHYNAFLNILSVGIPSIQTIHGSNSQLLFIRLNDIYHIPLSLLKTSIPHVFVELAVTWNKNKKRRFVLKIAELNNKGQVNVIEDEVINSFFAQECNSSDIFTINFLKQMFDDPLTLKSITI
ncbi:ATPase, T2SS/T4P/T4SS family [Candidatus Hodarchaeum mangrovi]